MKVTEGKVVTIDYEIRETDGTLIESSDDGPLSYIHGMGNLAPGLEKLLDDESNGEKVQAVLTPEQAFGEWDEGLIRQVRLDDFDDPEEVSPGLVFHAQENEEIRMYTVKSVEEQTVVIDGNHPFAGKTLDFSVTIREIRDSTPEEKEHGHVHGPGGHHHDH
jgi:FKBP-type peptidyl-prolyl cis-trans isomerase SlyD